MSASISTCLAGQGIDAPDLELAVFFEDLRNLAAQIDDAVLLDGPLDELLVALAAGADVDVENVGLAVMDVVLVEHGVLGRVHAADLGAVGAVHAPGSREPEHWMKTTSFGSLWSDGRRTLPLVGPEAEHSRSNWRPSSTSAYLP